MNAQHAPQGHMQRMMDMLNGLNQNTQGAVQTAQMAQQLQQQGQMAPLQQEQEQARTNLLQQQGMGEQLQNEAHPDMMRAKLQEIALQGVGAAARGFGYADPQMAPQLLRQLLEQHGIMQPGSTQPQDPKLAVLRQALAQHGYSPSQPNQQ